MLTLQRRNEPLMGRDSYFEDQWDHFRADLRAKDDKGWTDMELVGVDDVGLFCSIKVHRAVVLPLLRSVVSPLLQDLDCPTLVFPDTSVTVLRAIVTLFYEGTIITSPHITSEVLTTLKNLGIDPDRLTKTFLTIFEPRKVLEGLSSAQHETKKKKRKASKEEEGEKEKENGKKRRRKGRERSHSCQLCEFWCETVKAMSEHTESQHPGQTLHCPYPGCQRQLESYMKLRTHQHYAKHFITDHNKEKDKKDSRDVEKSFKLNNNENAEAGTETNETEGGKSLESLQEEDQTGTTEVNLSTDQPSDVKPEFDEETKE